MLPLIRAAVPLILVLSSALHAPSGEKVAHPAFDYQAALTHEIKPHRRTIPHQGIRAGFNQLHLTLIVSPTGDVVSSDAAGEPALLKIWPQLQGEVSQWKFTPFEMSGKPVTAEVEEYIDLVPPERLPKTHIPAPALLPNSRVAITLERSGCYGTCPSYEVTVSTTDGIVFNGSRFVVAGGKHTEKIDPDAVRKLAKKFIAADFYSMDAKYRASVTDNPTYVLSLSIDGHDKQVLDYVGEWEGMPAVITDLEDDVDTLANTQRWIKGGDGLVTALQAEEFNFDTYSAQTMLKEASGRGNSATVRELLDAGVPLKPLPAPKSDDKYRFNPFDKVGWLAAAGEHAEILQVLVDAGASKEDQSDKDLALVSAARSGNIAGAKLLIAYGANPNADLSALTVTDGNGGMATQGSGSGSILIYAAQSGEPELVRLVLNYHPKVKARDREGKNAIFAAAEDYRDSDKDGDRVECVRLLAAAGADINARDKDGNTPLHETFLTDVEEELIKLGANVNARNKEGETPIFTTVDDAAIPLFIEHGADLTIRNNKGQTVVEAATDKGPLRQEALRQAILKFNQR